MLEQEVKAVGFDGIYKRPWGRAINFKLNLPTLYDCCLEIIRPGQRIPSHHHPKLEPEGLVQYELVIGGSGYVFKGKNRIKIDDGLRDGKPAFFKWKPNEEHGYEADKHKFLAVITISYPSWKPEYDLS